MTTAQTITTIPSQILQMESTDHSSPMVALTVSIFFPFKLVSDT